MRIAVTTILILIATSVNELAADCDSDRMNLKPSTCLFALTSIQKILGNSKPQLISQTKEEANSLILVMSRGSKIIKSCVPEHSATADQNPMSDLLSSYMNVLILIDTWKVSIGEVKSAQKVLDVIYEQMLTKFPPAIEWVSNKSLNADASKAGAG